MNYYFDVLKKYATFHGRARRKEYWMFVLVNIIIFILLKYLDGNIGIGPKGVFGIIAALYWIATFIPHLAVAVRRLHDTGNSGWMLLIVLIPIVGPIALIVFLATDSRVGGNRYGPNPKELTIGNHTYSNV